MPSGSPQLPYPAFFECLSEGCRFRFPVLSPAEAQTARACPRCGAPTIMSEVNSPPNPSGSSNRNLPAAQPVEVLLDNIRSAHNVGSIFRTSDGAGIQRLHLCGVTPTPVQPAVTKTSLGAEKTISWSYHTNGKLAAQYLRSRGFLLWALETGPDSIPLFSLEYPPPTAPIAMVIGNEVAGIDPGILNLCDAKVSIPMCGAKGSLNVANAFSIAAYSICYRLRW